MSSHLQIIINGEVVMDDDTAKWEQRQPDFITKALADMSNGRPAPYMRSLMLVVAEAAITQSYTKAEVKSDGSGWSLDVRYAIELEA